MKIGNVERNLVNWVEECSEDSDGNEMILNATLNDYRRVCNSCTIYAILLIITFIMGSICLYFC